jgi:Malonate decarboxylase, alpha subunit, transporter
MPPTAEHLDTSVRSWTTRREEKKRRLGLVADWMNGLILRQEKIVEALELLVAPADRVVIEGDNQKQADFLSRSLVKVDPKRVHTLHLIIFSISRPEHLALFEVGIAKKIEFAYRRRLYLRVALGWDSPLCKSDSARLHRSHFGGRAERRPSRTDLPPRGCGKAARGAPRGGRARRAF